MHVGAILVMFNMLAGSIVNAILLNLGVFPDQSPSAALYMVTGIGKFPLSISAYGTFNDALVAPVVLNMNEIRHRWPNRKKGTMRTAMLPVEGKDEAGGVDYS